MAVSDWGDLFQSAGQQYGVDPLLLRAIATRESGGNAEAVSPQGAIGPMQILPETAKALGVSDPTDPKQAIPAAARLLMQNAKQFGTPESAVLAYHGGTDQKNWGPKTKAYLANVTQTYQQLKSGNAMPQAHAQDPFSVAFGDAGGSAPKPAAPSSAGPDPFSVAFGNSEAPTKTAPSAAAAAPTAQQSKASPALQGPESFSDYVGLKMPFAQDAVAGGIAGLDTLANKLTGKSGIPFSDAYHANLNQLQANELAYEQEHPNLSTIGTGLSFLAAGKPVNALASATKQTLPVLIKEGAKGGAALGTLFGAGTPTGPNETFGDRAGHAAVGGALGAGLGATLPVVGAGIAQGGRFAGKIANKIFPSVEQMAATKAKGIIDQFAGGPVTAKAPVLVPGSQPTLAEASGNPGVAALYRAVRDLNPNSPLITREGQNASARSSAFEGVAGTPEDIEALVDARNAQAKVAREQIFAPSKGILGAEDHPELVAAMHQADIAPVTQKIDEILAGSSGNRPAVKSAMADAKAMLQNDKGQAITDAKTLYDSARKGINDLISGKDLTKSYGATAASQLISVRDALDEAIEKQAPGFKSYLSKYEEDSGPIDALKFLQGQNVTDAKGNLTLAKVQGALKRLDQQQAAPGVKQGKSVTDAQRGVLESIRDDLLRAQNTSLGKAIGSNTVQNAMAQKRLGLSRFIPEGIGATVGTGLGGLVGGVHGAEFGGVLGDRLGSVVGHFTNARQQQMNNLVQSNVEDMMLNPARYENPIRQSKSATLDDILNDARTRSAIGIANRLAIMHELRRKNLDASRSH